MNSTQKIHRNLVYKNTLPQIERLFKPITNKAEENKYLYQSSYEDHQVLLVIGVNVVIKGVVVPNVFVIQLENMVGDVFPNVVYVEMDILLVE